MTPKAYAFALLKSGYLESTECRQWQRGGIAGVKRILTRIHEETDRLNDREHDVIWLLHCNYNIWARRHKKPKLAFPKTLQARRDAIIRKRRLSDFAGASQ